MTRSQGIWVFATAVPLALLFWLVPDIDLTVSGWFYDHDSQTWPLKNHPLAAWIYTVFRYAPHVIIPIMLTMIGLSFWKSSIDRRGWLFLFLTLLIGPGLLVHNVFKEGFDRSRPRQVVEFDGVNQFTPAFVISDTCQKSCNSFVSGHAAMGFWWMALAWALRLPKWLWIGLITGIIVGGVRIIQGGHFLSDTIFAGYLTYFTCLLMSPLLTSKTGSDDPKPDQS